MLNLSTILLSIICSLNLITTNNKAEGTICVWAHESIKNYEESRVLELKVYIDGKWIGMLNKAFAKMPSCGITGVLTQKIEAGQHSIEVKGIHCHAQNHSNQQKVNWRGRFEVKANAYISLEIGNHDTPKILEKRTSEIGNLAIWLHESVSKNVRDIKVYIDNKYQGRLTKGFLQERTCKDKGTITKQAKFGQYEIKVIGIRRDIKANNPKRKFEFIRRVQLSENCFSLPIYFVK